MVELKENLSEITDSNLVYLLEKKEDLDKLLELKLDKSILSKILEIIKKWENKVINFFIWNSNFENIYIMYFNKSWKSTLIEFLWENFPKLPEKLTLLSNNNDNLIDIINSCLLSRYKFGQYKTEKKEDIIFILSTKDTKKLIQDRLNTIENIILARDLWETPACDLTPENFTKIVKNTEFKNTKVKVLTPKDIEEKWLWLIYAVWKWSSNKPYMVILERIVDKKFPTYWLVWKWIVFDTGWLDIKSSDWMYPMKDDMCWAWTVFCTMKELDKKDLKINIVACLCLAENSVSWDSYRPSDIIKSYSWKTVNITNTDAEGRLVLADWVSYVSKNYKLDTIMTVATLTWVALFALGFRYAWIMWTDRFIIDILLSFSKTDFEKYCELPFDNYYVEKCKSEIADLDNWSKWIYTWSTMWWAFIYNFIENGEKFVHLDIAWVANNSFEPYGLYSKSTTWFWVDSLSKLFLSL